MLLSLILAAAVPAVAAKPVCQTVSPTPIREDQRNRVRPMNSEPPARQYYTVLRSENGCQKLVLVNEERRARPR